MTNNSISFTTYRLTVFVKIDLKPLLPPSNEVTKLDCLNVCLILNAYQWDYWALQKFCVASEQIFLAFCCCYIRSSYWPHIKVYRENIAVTIWVYFQPNKGTVEITHFTSCLNIYFCWQCSLFDRLATCRTFKTFLYFYERLVKGTIDDLP